MPSIAVALLAAAMQQGTTQFTGFTSPASGDTVGYWQQGIHYTIAATLDENARRVRARGTLRYVNNSPDTLREMYFHQYLNAFRPGSRWSEVDEREGRVRFQHLDEPDYGYERFTAPIRVNGAPVTVAYPGSPDSTVARIALLAPLAPGDTALLAFEWDARPSTVPRRQGRRGRHWDLAQWYPKVAVYDRGGWQPNALQPAGELYGEFGTYDVTLYVADDQVLGATGVPVSGDPGWTRALRAGISRNAANAYTSVPAHDGSAPAGFKAVRFVARNVHHFAWSASPEFRYEGGTYARALPARRFPTWDTVSIHVLYRPGDDSTWGGERVVRRTITAMQWLESIYGPYAYPQMTVLHRLDGGGTEFPMMQANGSPSLGLILHEGGHVWTYGILANNEWRSGWMDEGLTSYQTAWAQLLTPQERSRAGTVDRFPLVRGYGARAIRMRLPRFESLNLGQSTTDLEGGAEPMGTIAHEFRDFGTYNGMIYSRAEVMYGQLRDVLGDSAFVAFLHDYYFRWALKHVDERSMRASAERVSGRDLGWFFDQWVHRTGVMDYSLQRPRTSRDSSGAWVTDVRVRRRGEYRHPMPVGVRTKSGWTFGRMKESDAPETVRIRTTDEPIEVRLDPLHLTWDWDRRNDVWRRRASRFAFDWPFLDQADRERGLALLSPVGWYSEPGGILVGVRDRSSYLGAVDKTEVGAVYAIDPRADLGRPDRLQIWGRFESLYLPGLMRRPAMGWHAAFARLDGVVMADIGRRREFVGGAITRLSDIALSYSDVVEGAIAPELWTGKATMDLSARFKRQVELPRQGYWFFESGSIVGHGADDWFAKADVALGGVRLSEKTRAAIRAYGAVASQVPSQRALLLNAADPISTYWNHFWRPRGALLKRPGFNWLPLGGAGLKGYRYGLGSDAVGAANLDMARRVGSIQGSNTLALWAHAFGDGAVTDAFDVLGDAGLGVSVRGRFYDREVNIRIDSPFFVSKPVLAIGRDPSSALVGGGLAGRWVITFNDLW